METELDQLRETLQQTKARLHDVSVRFGRDSAYLSRVLWIGPNMIAGGPGFSCQSISQFKLHDFSKIVLKNYC